MTYTDHEEKLVGRFNRNVERFLSASPEEINRYLAETDHLVARRTHADGDHFNLYRPCDDTIKEAITSAFAVAERVGDNILGTVGKNPTAYQVKWDCIASICRETKTISRPDSFSQPDVVSLFDLVAIDDGKKRRSRRGMASSK